MKLNDGAVTVFLNTCGKADDVSGELKAFLDFMMGKTSSDPFIRRLEERLIVAKQNAKWRRNYMLLLLHDWETRNEARNEALAEGRAEGLTEGRAEGLAEGRAEGRATGLAEGLSIGKEQGRAEVLSAAIEFMKSAGMSEETINSLRNAVLKS